MWCFIEEDAMHRQRSRVHPVLLNALPSRIYRDLTEHVVDISGSVACSHITKRLHVGESGEILYLRYVFDAWELRSPWPTVRIDHDIEFL